MTPFSNDAHPSIPLVKERFDVLDLGGGEVGLYHTGYRRYVLMTNDKVAATPFFNPEERWGHGPP